MPMIFLIKASATTIPAAKVRFATRARTPTPPPCDDDDVVDVTPIKSPRKARINPKPIRQEPVPPQTPPEDDTSVPMAYTGNSLFIYSDRRGICSSRGATWNDKAGKSKKASRICVFYLTGAFDTPFDSILGTMCGDILC